MNASVRQHLLDFYDVRFCSADLIFWWYSVLSRHTTIRNTASYFKKDSDAKRRFEDLCNDEDLEDSVKAAMRYNSSADAKALSKEFTSLINVIGGHTPWSSAERQKTLGRLYAISNFMGPPSVFFTIAPCIADSEICMKLLNLQLSDTSYENQLMQRGVRGVQETLSPQQKLIILSSKRWCQLL